MLTTQQKQTLKTWLLANAGAMNDQQAAAALNAQASPAFWVWKSSVGQSEITGSISVDGTAFTWVGNGFITRSAGEQAAWGQIFDAEGNVNPSETNVRQAFSDIFSGTGNALANLTHLLAVSRRTSTLAEKLLATGTGSTASPATMGYEGSVSAQDVVDSLNS